MTMLKYSFIITTALCLVIIYHTQKYVFRPLLHMRVVYKDDKDLGIRDPRVTCEFPILHPFEPSILHLVEVAKPIRCYRRFSILTYMSEDGLLKFNKTAMIEENYKGDGSDIDCTYSEITRVPNDDFHVIYEPEKRFIGNDRPKSDFIYVTCRSKLTGLVVYNYFHAFAQRNPNVRKFRNDEEVGVAVIGLDSLSRLNFMRQMAKSYKFLTSVMQAKLMYGFTKVGENTLPNVGPMLTGTFNPKPPYNRFRGWPFIWKNFSKAGAATMYAEDQPDINMFDYLNYGIEEQPTHHYMRTFWLAVESAFLYKMSSTYCLGPLPKHLIYFDYLKSFLRMYRDSPVFLFSLLNEFTHDYINIAGAIDDDFVQFLNSSFQEGLFNRTLLFVLGDHGNRMDPIRTTEIGRIEDSMPLVSIAMPFWLQKKKQDWFAALTANQNRLTSTFDIYKTFELILSTLTAPENLDDNEAVRFAQNEYDINKHFSGESIGQHLFNPMPFSRNCKDAGIAVWFCVCSVHEDYLDTQDIRAIGAAKAIIEHFNNNLLRELPQCSKYDVDSIEKVTINKNQKVGSFWMRISLYTFPGRGLFEGFVYLKNGTVNKVENVQRINVYGNQAHCLSKDLILKDPFLRAVCLCK